MHIQVPHELFAPAESSYFSGEYLLSHLKAGPDDYKFDKPLLWQLSVSNTGGALLVAGTVQGVATTSCARCLEEFSIPVSGDIEGYFLLSQEEEVPQDREEDEFEVLSEDGVINLTPLLDAALLVELPLIPLCDDDCKGLCSMCGQNLNETDCACVHDASNGEDTGRPNPFSVLKDIAFE